MESVIKVPGKLKSSLLGPCKAPEEKGLRITRDDGDGWELPSEEQVKYLNLFISGYYAGAPSRSWRAADGIRLGWNKEGVFLNENHTKRFFGICRANASISLRREVPEALPEFHAGVAAANQGGPLQQQGSTDRLLAGLMSHMPSISKDMRMQVLRATFKKADANNNGVLSRPEVGSLFRKVVNTMSARDVEEAMMEADKDHNHQISWPEFVDWLENSAPERVTSKLERSMNTEADIVKASFRVWDKNGDGLISRRELERTLARMCKEFSTQQIKSMCEIVDQDHDGNIDYDEFVDFLFHSFKGKH